MKLSKQFMQTNIKQSYLYWQHISLNNLQQGTDGLSSGNSYKENSRSKSIRSTFFPKFCEDYRLVLVYFFDQAVISCTHESFPCISWNKSTRSTFPNCVQFTEALLYELSYLFLTDPALSKVAGKEAKQHADVVQGIDKFKANLLTAHSSFYSFAHPSVSSMKTSKSR